MRWRLLVLLFPLVSSGCQSPCPWMRLPQCACYSRTMDDCLASKIARDVARQHMSTLHMSTLYESETECWPSNDFQAGFEQAYVDIALGSDGRVPAVAPALYWRSCQRTVDGHQRAQEWFSGYSIGASHALACRGPYNRVIASGSAGPCPPRSMSSCGQCHITSAASSGQDQEPDAQVTQSAE